MSAKLESTLIATWLPPDGYALLEKQFAEWGEPVPDPALSSVAIVIDTETNELAGFICAQSVIHVEPIYVNPDYRHSNALEMLIEKIQEPFKESGSGFYVFVPDSKIRHLVEEQGMTILPWQVAKKEFAKESG